MKKNVLTKENGFSTMDVLIAVMIIALFSSIVITFGYKIYLVNVTVARANTANGYAIAMLEQIDKMYYDEVTAGNLIGMFSSDEKVSIKDANNEEQLLETPYKIEIKIQNYQELMNDGREYLDLVKKITINVKYNVGNQEKNIEIARVKARENLKNPNVPEIALLSIDEATGEEAFPIKYENGIWKVTDEKDDTWYNYENGYYATVFVTTDDLEKGDTVDLTNNEDNVYIWIPRYAYSNENEDIKFLYYGTNKFVYLKDGVYISLEDIGNGYEIPFNENEAGRWISNAIAIDGNDQAYKILNTSKYKRKNV